MLNRTAAAMHTKGLRTVLPVVSAPGPEHGEPAEPLKAQTQPSPSPKHLTCVFAEAWQRRASTACCCTTAKRLTPQLTSPHPRNNCTGTKHLFTAAPQPGCELPRLFPLPGATDLRETDLAEVTAGCQNPGPQNKTRLLAEEERRNLSFAALALKRPPEARRG